MLLRMDDYDAVWWAGVLDACGRVYDDRIAVASRNRDLLERLHKRSGGSIDRNRWVLRGERRKAVLDDWYRNTKLRRRELQLELLRLGRPTA